MLRKVTFISLASLFLFGTRAAAEADEELLARLASIEPFEQSFLASTPSEGQQMQHLGRVMKLGLFKNKQVASKFNIFTRNSSTFDIQYDARARHCYGHNCHVFDLRRMATSGFDPRKKTVLLVPGYATNDRPGWILKARKLWLELADVNVVMFTWKDGNGPLYRTAVVNMPVVARQISLFLYYLLALHGARPDQAEFLERFQLVGHSLGAHVVGYVGKDFLGRIGHIVGLDPANPDMAGLHRNIRLDRKDARLVTVIHTNGGQLDLVRLTLEGLRPARRTSASETRKWETEMEELSPERNQRKPVRLGIDLQQGDLDLYANDGHSQPGCLGRECGCDHTRANKLYNYYLEYELALRRGSSPSSPQQLRDRRLLAFRADDYQELMTGQALARGCPSLLAGSQNRTQLYSCAVPIDFLSPLDEHVRELKELYKLDFDKQSYNPNNRFYLRTLAVPPFYGEQNLLRIKLDRASSSWDPSCTLKGKLYIDGGVEVGVKIDEGAELVDTENFFGLAVPFVRPIGQGSKDDDDEAESELKSEQADPPEEYYLPPGLVTLDHGQHDAKLPTEVALTISGGRTKEHCPCFRLPVSGGGGRRKCSLKVKSLEVAGVQPVQRKRLAVYGTPQQTGSSSTPKGSGQSEDRRAPLDRDVLSTDEYSTMVRRLTQIIE